MSRTLQVDKKKVDAQARVMKSRKPVKAKASTALARSLRAKTAKLPASRAITAKVLKSEILPVRSRVGKPAVIASPELRAELQAMEARVRDQLTLAKLLFEKCELRKAEERYTEALEEARRLGGSAGTRLSMEALSGLLRLAGEALDRARVEKIERELDHCMSANPEHTPPMAWYCKGAIARHWGKIPLAQYYFHRYLRAVKTQKKSASPYLEPGYDEANAFHEQWARGWVVIAMLTFQRGRSGRARWIAHSLLKRYESKSLKGINGPLYLLLENIAEEDQKLPQALEWLQKAHASFLGEHSWYHHLYILFGYARIARLQGNFTQAHWYLDLADKGASGAEFGVLRREISQERSRLDEDAVDLLVDSRKGIIRTRHREPVSLRKQYVLLHILEALWGAHSRTGDDSDRGLSKADIIQQVWGENYRPEAHDNKLYYNINRLRKLIEPDVSQPQYLLNWKEGYRLAPELRVRFVQSE